MAHNYGSHKLTLQSAFSEDDVVEINSDTRLVTRRMETGLRRMGFILIRQQRTVSIELR